MADGESFGRTAAVKRVDAYCALEVSDPRHCWCLIILPLLLFTYTRFSVISILNPPHLSSPSLESFHPIRIPTMKTTHTLLSGLLLLLPIVATVGVYIGLHIQQIFHSGFDGSYGIPTDSLVAKVGTNTYCQKSIGITPQNQRYTCKFLFRSVPFCFVLIRSESF